MLCVETLSSGFEYCVPVRGSCFERKSRIYKNYVPSSFAFQYPVFRSLKFKLHPVQCNTQVSRQRTECTNVPSKITCTQPLLVLFHRYNSHNSTPSTYIFFFFFKPAHEQTTPVFHKNSSLPVSAGDSASTWCMWPLSEKYAQFQMPWNIVGYLASRCSSLLGCQWGSLLGCRCCGLAAGNVYGLFPDAGVKIVGPLSGLPAVVDGLQVVAIQFRLVVGVSMGVAICGRWQSIQLLLAHRKPVCYLWHTQQQ